ncbi:MAG: sugar O-acetyltransferase [Coprobacillaceae bacterium]
MSEKEKAALQQWYDANNDSDLLKERIDAKDLCFYYNQTLPSNTSKKEEILEKLFGYLPDNLELLHPFQCDYGYNIKIKNNVFINHNCYFMDGAKINIGSYVFMGPNCGLYTAQHALNVEERNAGLEKALPITIGDNVWLGANVTVLPGVIIGNNSVIGAGSIVSKDIPDNVIAVGNPCKVIRENI